MNKAKEEMFDKSPNEQVIYLLENLLKNIKEKISEGINCETAFIDINFDNEVGIFAGCGGMNNILTNLGMTLINYRHVNTGEIEIWAYWLLAQLQKNNPDANLKSTVN